MQDISPSLDAFNEVSTITTSHEYVSRIHLQFSSLSKSQKRIAQFIISHPNEIVHYSITQLAQKTNTTPSTVTRFCQAMSYKGFSEMKVYIEKQLIPSTLSAEPIRANDSMQTVIFKLIHSSQSALRNTLRTVDAISIKRTADILLNANHIHIYGQSGGYVAGLYMQQMLLRAGILCQAVNDNLDMQLAANTLTQNDVAVGIAYSGEIRSVIQALTTARAKRAKVIVITATNGSSMAKLAHQVLLYSNDIPDDLHYLHIGSICEISIIGLLQSEILMRENQHEKVASVAKNIITSRKK